MKDDQTLFGKKKTTQKTPHMQKKTQNKTNTNQINKRKAKLKKLIYA